MPFLSSSHTRNIVKLQSLVPLNIPFCQKDTRTCCSILQLKMPTSMPWCLRQLAWNSPYSQQWGFTTGKPHATSCVGCDSWWVPVSLSPLRDVWENATGTEQHRATDQFCNPALANRNVPRHCFCYCYKCTLPKEQQKKQLTTQGEHSLGHIHGNPYR